MTTPILPGVFTKNRKIESPELDIETLPSDVWVEIRHSLYIHHLQRIAMTTTKMRKIIRSVTIYHDTTYTARKEWAPYIDFNIKFSQARMQCGEYSAIVFRNPRFLPSLSASKPALAYYKYITDLCFMQLPQETFQYYSGLHLEIHEVLRNLPCLTALTIDLCYISKIVNPPATLAANEGEEKEQRYVPLTMPSLKRLLLADNCTYYDKDFFNIYTCTIVPMPNLEYLSIPSLSFFMETTARFHSLELSEMPTILTNNHFPKLKTLEHECLFNVNDVLQLKNLTQLQTLVISTRYMAFSAHRTEIMDALLLTVNTLLPETCRLRIYCARGLNHQNNYKLITQCNKVIEEIWITGSERPFDDFGDAQLTWIPLLPNEFAHVASLATTIFNFRAAFGKEYVYQKISLQFQPTLTVLTLSAITLGSLEYPVKIILPHLTELCVMNSVIYATPVSPTHAPDQISPASSDYTEKQPWFPKLKTLVYFDKWKGEDAAHQNIVEQICFSAASTIRTIKTNHNNIAKKQSFLPLINGAASLRKLTIDTFNDYTISEDYIARMTCMLQLKPMYLSTFKMLSPSTQPISNVFTFMERASLSEMIIQFLENIIGCSRVIKMHYASLLNLPLSVLREALLKTPGVNTHFYLVPYPYAKVENLLTVNRTLYLTEHVIEATNSVQILPAFSCNHNH
jgi:hypothetical protein